MSGHGVHQVAAGAARRDAITNHMLAARSALRRKGLRSEIFIDEGHIDPSLAAEVHPHRAWDALTSPGDGAIVHYSIASAAFEHVAGRTDRLGMHYHNITPAQFLWEFAPTIAAECADGRRRLAELTGAFAVVGADSWFNANELADLGFADPTMIGILRSPRSPLPRVPPPDGEVRLLFVGRGVPNKAQHDLVLTLAALRETGVEASLRLVGSWVGVEAYERFCMDLAARVGVADFVQVTGSVSDEALADEYASASVFVCLSNHEGYCVPLVEAMENALPIVAYAAGAVPETAGPAALLLDEKPPSLVAEAILATLHERPLLDRMEGGRREQLELLGDRATLERLDEFVEKLS